MASGAGGSARLGLTLRRVLLAPHDGFAAAFKTAERRAKAGRRPAEGVSPYVLAAIGGASATALWLKLGSLSGLRRACTDQHLGLLVAAALVVGALLGLLAQQFWGGVGPATIRGLHGDTDRGSLRLVWGAAAFPQVVWLLVLLPLDLLIIGTDAYSPSSLEDPLSTAWAAFSIAIGISLAVWSLFLFVKGLEVAAGIGFWKAVAAMSVASVFFVAVIGAPVIIGSISSEVRSCPTRLG